MPKLKKAHAEENIQERHADKPGRGARGAEGEEQGARAGKGRAGPGSVYRFKILRGKMPSRRFIVAERTGGNVLAALGRALHLSK